MNKIGEIQTKLGAARTRLILERPFIGALVMHLPLLPAAAAWCETTATDARALYYNPEYIAGLTLGETQFVLAHEAMHCALGHFARRSHRVRRRWDIACVKGNTLIPGDYARIDEIQVGRQVFGLSGTKVKVTRTFVNQFAGNLIRIKAAYLSPIEVTPEHPLLVVPFSMKMSRGMGTSKKIFGKPEWLEAKNVTRSHMLVVPKLKASVDLTALDLELFVNRQTKVNGHDQAHRIRMTRLPLDAETAWMMGVYVAEGSASGSNGIKFSLSRDKDQEILQRLTALFRDRFGLSPQIQNPTLHPHTTYFGIASPILMRAFAHWFGRGAHEKRIPDWLLQHRDTEILRHFLAGYIAGDGTVYTKGRQAIALDTASEKLALQLQLVLARFAGLLTIQKKRQVPRTIRGKALPEGWIYKLQSRNPRVLDFLGLRSNSKDCRTFAHDVGDHWLVRIRGVSVNPHRGPVYNIETEDHSYLVGNAVVHNCDHAVNLLLVNEGLKPPLGALANPDFRGLSAEEIYPLIPPEPAERTLDRHLFDDHESEPRSDSRSEAGDERRPGRGRGAFPLLDAGPGERAELARRWQSRVVSAAQQARRAGRLAESWLRLVDGMIQPRLPWRVLLARYLMSVARDDYSFQRPSRREGDALLPRLASGEVDLCVALDTSGSIRTEELAQFASEVDALKGQIRARVTLHACDERLDPRGPWEFQPWEAIVLPHGIGGGGGTRFVPVFDWIAAGHRRPDLLLYFTDAEGEFPRDAPGFPVIWLVKGSGKVPWGERIQLN